MAANEYYNQHPHPIQSRYDPFDQQPPAPPPASSKPYAPSSYNPYSQNQHPTYPQNNWSPQRPYDEYNANHDYSDSQQTLRPQPNQYSTSSLDRPDDHGQYADDIPLKSAAKVSGTPDDWQHQNTQYNPASIESQRPDMATEKERKGKKGWFKGRIPYVVYLLTLIQCSVFIGEIVKNAILTGSPIEIHPSFNYMIGPSIEVLINMGARYVPCMRTIAEIQNSTETIQWPCPNTTTTDTSAASNQCTLSEMCGFGGLNFDNPNQWWRFITPMFLHAGIIHIGINMLMQLTMGREMEKQIGSLRFALVYFSSGIFGFVLGGNFAATGIATTGASGALFGILGLFLLDLFYTWKTRTNPIRDLLLSLLDIAIAFVIGLLPGVVDNFSHMGGLLCGLVLGLCILRSPNVLRQRIGEDPTPYAPMNPSSNEPRLPQTTSMQNFAKQPVGFFKGRKPLWWAWWLVRAGALVGVLVCFVVLLNNFYKYRNTCSWCKYLSCLPVKNWCDIGNLQLSNVSTSSSKRDLFGTYNGGMNGLAYGFFD